MSATLHSLPATTTMTVDMALDSAKALNLQDVMVIGYDPEGRLAIRSSRLTREAALFLVEAAKMHALQPLIADYAQADKE